MNQRRSLKKGQKAINARNTIRNPEFDARLRDNTLSPSVLKGSLLDAQTNKSAFRQIAQ